MELRRHGRAAFLDFSQYRRLRQFARAATERVARLYQRLFAQFECLDCAGLDDASADGVRRVAASDLHEVAQVQPARCRPLLQSCLPFDRLQQLSFQEAVFHHLHRRT